MITVDGLMSSTLFCTPLLLGSTVCALLAVVNTILTSLRLFQALAASDSSITAIVAGLGDTADLGIHSDESIEE